MSAAEGLRFWHYTIGIRVLDIVAAGKLIRARTGLPLGERPAVWFTTRPVWEPTATKGLEDASGLRRATMPEMMEFGGALVRIEVPAAVARYTWTQHRQMAHIDLRHADGLEAAARAAGSDPAEWRVSYRDVPVESFLAIEAYDPDAEAWALVGAPADTEGLTLHPVFVAAITRALEKGGG